MAIIEKKKKKGRFEPQEKDNTNRPRRQSSIGQTAAMAAFHCTVATRSVISPVSSWTRPSSTRCCPSSVSQSNHGSPCFLVRPMAAADLCPDTTHYEVDKSLVKIDEAFDEDELWAAACLRVRSFYHFRPSAFSVQVSKLWIEPGILDDAAFNS